MNVIFYGWVAPSAGEDWTIIMSELYKIVASFHYFKKQTAKMVNLFSLGCAAFLFI